MNWWRHSLEYWRVSRAGKANILKISPTFVVYSADMAACLSSDAVNASIEELLLSGSATTAFQAEEMYLDSHLPDLMQLVAELDDAALEQHEAIKLLMAHGSRRREDALQ